MRQKSIGASARNRKLVANLIEGYADKAPAKMAPLLRKMAPLAGWVFAINKIGFDVSVVIYTVCNKYFSRLPYHLVMCVFGLILCFFGESSSSSSGKGGSTCAQRMKGNEPGSAGERRWSRRGGVEEGWGCGGGREGGGQRSGGAGGW